MGASGAFGASARQWKTFAFASSDTAAADWRRFDWDKLTTLAVFDGGGRREIDRGLVELAHSRGCRVVRVVDVRGEDLDDEKVLEEWMEEVVREAAEGRLDGANLVRERSSPAV